MVKSLFYLRYLFNHTKEILSHKSKRALISWKKKGKKKKKQLDKNLDEKRKVIRVRAFM